MKLTSGKFKLSKQKGQGMTEYIIIVALIAVAAIGVYQLFGATVRNQTAAIAMEVSGQDGTAVITQAGKAASNAKTVAAKDKGLATYGDQVTEGKQK
ncbi:pilus assembly protein [Rugamonas sp. CCM 8940]|nr:pilus assembly protein [Rugamonas sp. CCM 8940]MBJ7311276.1 pilus assembly protein [Rugamonas sp. CCM 8940]